MVHSGIENWLRDQKLPSATIMQTKPSEDATKQSEPRQQLKQIYWLRVCVNDNRKHEDLSSETSVPLKSLRVINPP